MLEPKKPGEVDPGEGGEGAKSTQTDTAKITDEGTTEETKDVQEK